MTRTKPGLRAIVVGAVTALALAGCGDEKQDVFTPEGEKAQSIQDLQVPVFAIAVVVGVLVAIAIAVLVVQGRRRFKDDGTGDPVQLEGNFKLEIGWTIAPAVLLAVISVFTVSTLFGLDDADALPPELDAMEITVYGQQWWWSFEYDFDGDDEPEIVTANDLVIPAGVDITLNIESRDVIHSFWIPALNGTRDAVPGRTHTLVLQANEPGEYEGQCKEYCGLSHANMRARTIALSMPDFMTWHDQQMQSAEMLDEDDPNFAGQQAFIANCTRCHQVNGLEDAEGEPIITEGDAPVVPRHVPNLTHLMSREVYAGGMFNLYDPVTGGFDRAQLEAWIRNAPEQKPMFPTEDPDTARGMPAVGLTEEDIDAVVDYLVTLGPRPPSPAGPDPTAPTTDEAGS